MCAPLSDAIAQAKIGAMTSAAEELLTIIKDWAVVPRGVSTLGHRADASGDWWTSHARAVELTCKVEAQALRMAEARPMLKDALPVLEDVKALIFPNLPINEMGDEIRLIPESSIIAFAGLAAAVSVRDSSVAEQVTEALEAVADLVELITGISSLKDEVRAYLLSLCEQLQETLTDWDVDDADLLGARVYKLLALLNFEVTDTDERQKFDEVVKRFFNATARLVFVDVPTGVAAGIGTNFVSQMLALNP